MASVKEMRAAAKARGVKGYYKMNKSQLMQATGMGAERKAPKGDKRAQATARKSGAAVSFGAGKLASKYGVSKEALVKDARKALKKAEKAKGGALTPQEKRKAVAGSLSSATKGPRDTSLGGLFKEADRVGSKYQKEGDPINMGAKRAAKKIYDESGMSGAIARAKGKSKGGLTAIDGGKSTGGKSVMRGTRDERYREISDRITDREMGYGTRRKNGPETNPANNRLLSNLRNSAQNRVAKQDRTVRRPAQKAIERRARKGKSVDGPIAQEALMTAKARDAVKALRREERRAAAEQKLNMAAAGSAGSGKIVPPTKSKPSRRNRLSDAMMEERINHGKTPKYYDLESKLTPIDGGKSSGTKRKSTRSMARDLMEATANTDKALGKLKGQKAAIEKKYARKGKSAPIDMSADQVQVKRGLAKTKLMKQVRDQDSSFGNGPKARTKARFTKRSDARLGALFASSRAAEGGRADGRLSIKDDRKLSRAMGFPDSFRKSKSAGKGKSKK